MPDQKAINQGYEFEKYVADILGQTLQPGSGNKFFAKNDSTGKGLSVSSKSQKKFSWLEILTYLNQSIDDTYGTENIPSLAVEDKDYHEQVIVMRLSDFAKAFQEDIKIPEHSDSPGIAKRKSAEVPLMLRD